MERDANLEIVFKSIKRGNQTADQIADDVGLVVSTVRRHAESLVADKRVRVVRKHVARTKAKHYYTTA